MAGRVAAWVRSSVNRSFLMRYQRGPRLARLKRRVAGLTCGSSILQAPLLDLREERQSRLFPSFIVGRHLQDFGANGIRASWLKAEGIGALPVRSMFNESIFELLPYLIWNRWFGSIIDKTEPRGHSLNTPELSDDLRKQISLHRLQFSLTKL